MDQPALTGVLPCVSHKTTVASVSEAAAVTEKGSETPGEVPISYALLPYGEIGPEV